MRQIILSTMLVAIIAICCSCKGNPKAQSVNVEDCVVIPFESVIENEHEVLLSNLAEKVEYIPLQTDSSCLVGNCWENNIIRSKKYYFLADGKNLFQYLLNGKFIRNIGSVGQGPGEYTWITDIDVLDESNRIFVSSGEKINVYDTETGGFIRALPCSYIDCQFRMLNDSIAFRFLYNINGQVKHRILITASQGDTIQAYTRSDLFTVKEDMAFMIGSPNDRYIYRSGSNICYRENYNDTIFTVTKQMLIPRYIINLGKYHLPLEYRFEVLGDEKKFADMAANYLAIHPIETKDYLFISYEGWNDDKESMGKLVIYDKRNGECYRVAGGRLKDDMNHFFDFRPMVALDDHTLLKVFPAEIILKYAKKNPSIFEHESLKSLGEDDNPVLMIVTLKK